MSAIGKQKRDRMVIIHQLLTIARYPVSQSRLGRRCGLHHDYFKEYEAALVESGMLEKLGIDQNYRTNNMHYRLQTTAKGETVRTSIYKLYEMFNVRLKRDES